MDLCLRRAHLEKDISEPVSQETTHGGMRQWLLVAGLSCQVKTRANSTHRSSCVIFYRLSRVGRDRGFASLSILHSDVVTVATDINYSYHVMLFLEAPGELYAESFTIESKSLENWHSLRSCCFFRNKINNNILILLWQVRMKVLCTSKTFDLGMLFCLLDPCWAST